jgi:hypothetical protein
MAYEVFNKPEEVMPRVVSRSVVAAAEQLLIQTVERDAINQAGIRAGRAMGVGDNKVARFWNEVHSFLLYPGHPLTVID